MEFLVQQNDWQKLTKMMWKSKSITRAQAKKKYLVVKLPILDSRSVIVDFVQWSTMS